MRKFITNPIPSILKYESVSEEEAKCHERQLQSRHVEARRKENNVRQEGATEKLQVVRGYYSDDDVKLLLDALLNKKGIKKIGELKDKEDGSFIANVFFSGGKKAIILAPIIEGAEDTKGRITQLKKDLVAAYNNKIDHILVPINKHSSHWYSLKLEVSYNGDVVVLVGWYLHDSLYKRSTLQHISDNLEVIVLTSFGISTEQLIGKPSLLPLIQRGVGGAINCYCGGYTARLIANLIMNPYADQYSNEEAWSCLDNRDDILRHDDARIVAQHNSHNAWHFGAKPMYESEAILKAQEASLSRSFIANEKARQIIQELKSVYDDIPEEVKLCIRSLNIQKDPSSLSAIVRDLYTGMPFLKDLFKTNAAGELERDAEGLLKLDTTIEMEQVYHIMIEFQRTWLKLEGIEVPELEDKVIELVDQPDLIEVGPHKEADNDVSFVNKLSGSIQYIYHAVIMYEITPYLGNIKIYNSKFEGRTRELKIIQAKLKSTKAVTIKGVSGVGKTSIAWHYARTTQEYIPIWFKADSRMSLIKSYREFGESLKLNLDRLEETMVMNIINSKIANSKQRILFIFDDLNGDYALNYLRALPYNARLLITTRQGKQLGKIEEELWLGQFSQKKASEYLKNNGIKQQEIDLLIEKIGTIPQHLSLVVGYLRYNEAKTLETRENTLKAKTIFEITIGEIAKKHKTAWEVLQYVVWLDPNFIPEEILSELVDSDIQELWSAIRELENYSLVSVVEKTDNNMLGLEVHRNLQNEVMLYINKYSDQDTAQLLVQVLQALNKLLPKVTSNFDESWIKARLYVSSVESIFNHMSSRKIKLVHNLDIATLNLKLGLIYMEMLTDCKNALSYTTKALHIMQAIYKRDHSDVASSLSYVGIAYQKLGCSKLSFTYSKLALKMRQALYKGDHPDVANSLNNLGVISRALGDAQLGIAYCKQALEMRQVLYPGNHHQLVASFNNIGLVYNDLKDYDNSLVYYKCALEMRQALYKGNHRDVATSLAAVGQGYEKLGHVGRSLDYKMQALRMQQALNLGDHPDIVNSLNSMGQAYEKLGNVKKGLLYYKQALQMNKVLYSGYHLVIAGAFDTVGAAYYKLNDIRNSILYYEQALKIKQAFYKCHHPDIATSLNTIGIAHEKLGDIKRGLSYYKQVLEMRRALHEGNHPEVVTSLNVVGGVYEQLGDINGGVLFYRQALKMSQALYKWSHPSVATSLNNVGNAYAMLGDIGRGLDYQERALHMRQALYQDTHPDVVTSLNNVGVAYYKLGNVRNGIVYQEQALKILQALQPRGLIITIAFNNVAAVYKDLGDVGKYSICNKLAAFPKGFVNKRGLVTEDIIAVKLKLQNKVLNTIQALSANGVWSKKIGLYNYGVLGYLKERYLIKQLGDTSNVQSLSIARSLCFEAISIGITNSKQHPICAIEFAKLYPNLISVIAEEHPEYFVIETIAKACLSVEEYRKVISLPPKAVLQSQEFKGQGTLCYAGKSYQEYYNTAVDKILNLRLGDLKVKRLDACSLREDLASLHELAYKVTSEFSNTAIEFVVAPYNFGGHWLGLVFRKLDNVIEIIHIDSEQEAISLWIKSGLKSGLSMKGYKVHFLKLGLEKQRYNNCGPELIENFVYYLTGTRATQENAVYLHSLLLENDLLNSEEYRLRLEENNQLIVFLSNAKPIEITEVPFLVDVAEQRPMVEERVSHIVTAKTERNIAQGLNFFEGFGPCIVLFYKKLLYRKDLKVLNGMIRDYGIELPSGLATVDVLLDNSKFNKLIMNRIHPDKNPFGADIAHEDTLFVRELRDKFAADLNMKKVLDDSIVQINSVLYKASIGFKVLDVVVDSARLSLEPTVLHAKKLALGFVYLYGMYSGVNGYSMMVGGAESLYQIYMGEHQVAFNIVTTTLGSMALPYILAQAGIPYLGFAYGVIIAGYTSYHAIHNAYSFILEHKTEDAALHSIMAYRDAAKALSESPLQQIYDFSTAAEEYETQASNLLAGKTKLEEEQGE